MVPVSGPNSPIGMRIRAPTTTPSTVAATACHQRQAQQHRERPEDDGGERVRPAELDAEQVQRPGVPVLGVGDRVDAVLLHLGRARTSGVRRQARPFRSAHLPYLRVGR